MTARSSRGLLAIVVVLIVYGSLYPFHFVPVPNYTDFLSPEPGRGGMVDFALNLFLYMPVGFLLFERFAWAGPRLRLALSCILGTLMSGAIELTQGFDLTRSSSLYDIVSNGLGSLGGALLAAAIPAFSLKRKIGLRPALLAAFWILYQVYPLVPYISAAAISRSAAGLHEWSSIAALLFAVDWFVAFALLAEALPLLRRRAAALLVLLMPVKLVVFERRLSSAEVAGALAAVVIFIVLRRVQTRTLAAVLAAMLIVRELAPFHFGPPSAFGWLPFGASLALQDVGSVVILLGKAFVYGSAVWFLSEAGLRLRTATLSVSVVLFALEWMQRWIPGRTPEITDSLLALLIGAVLALASPQPPLHSSTVWSSPPQRPEAA